jgi:RNA polymerase sigma-70 factor (ECF subfamily)
MANEWNRARTQKRGHGQIILSLDDDSAEHRYCLEPMDKATPESLFERRWALTLLDSVLLRLEEEHRREGKQRWIEVMRPALAADQEGFDYKEMAQKLELTETAARVAVHRLRKRYRQLIRTAVGLTVASPLEIEAEIRPLFQVLTRG